MRDRFGQWLPVISLMLVSVISYVDRTTMALLAPTILRETHISNQQYGFIVSAFSIAYMIGNPVWGLILDRIGTRLGMLISVTLWTAASASHAFAGNFTAFAVARGALGFGEGATFPGAMRTATQTLDAGRRSRGIALSYSGGSLGAIITPIVLTPVAAAFGWRGAFWLTGAIGALWLAHWLVISRRTDLRALPPHQQESAGLSFRDPRVWAFIVTYSMGAVPLGFVLNMASLYLSNVLHKNQTEIGAVLWIPPLGWEVGYFFWGWATDRFLKSGADTIALRKTFLALALLSLTLIATPAITSYAATMALLFFTMFLAAGFIIGSLAYANNCYSLRHSGFIAGLGAGSWSALVAVVMPFFGRLFDQHQYASVFLIASLFPTAGFLLWWILDSLGTRRLETVSPAEARI